MLDGMWEDIISLLGLPNLISSWNQILWFKNLFEFSHMVMGMMGTIWWDGCESHRFVKNFCCHTSTPYVRQFSVQCNHEQSEGSRFPMVAQLCLFAITISVQSLFVHQMCASN
jgi:hypothetical protein